MVRKLFCYIEPHFLLMLGRSMKTLDAKLVPILEERYGPKWWPVQYPEEVSKDPFKNLVLTVLLRTLAKSTASELTRGYQLSLRLSLKFLRVQGKERLEKR